MSQYPSNERANMLKGVMDYDTGLDELECLSENRSVVSTFIRWSSLPLTSIPRPERPAQMSAEASQISRGRIGLMKWWTCGRGSTGKCKPIAHQLELQSSKF